METPKRLQVYLAECGVGSRRKSEQLIEAGAVSVNNKVVTTQGTKVTPGRDKVSVNGKVISPEEKRVFVFYKPSGVVTTMSDPQGRPCVAHYTRKLPVRVFPVGRLDYDVTGVLLLTNDGDLAERLLHPRFSVLKVYWAIVSGVIEKRATELLCRGVKWEEEVIRAKYAKRLSPSPKTKKLLGVIAPGESVVELGVSEGKKHLVKHLLEGVGHPVKKLCRVQFGPYDLEALKPGQIVEVTDKKFSSPPMNVRSAGNLRSLKSLKPKRSGNRYRGK